MAAPIPHRTLKAHLAGGGKVVNGWCSIPSTVTAEIVARRGFDTVTIDLQHGLIDYQTALAMLQVVDAHGMPTLCRVPWNEAGIVMKALDAGFSGVICPMINSKDDAVRFAGACRYSPRGYRSFGPTRALNVYGSDYVSVANDFVAAIGMIETRAALDNLDAILEVEELDAVYIGPADLALSLGFAPTLLPEEPAVLEAIADIRARAKRAGKAVGLHCGLPETVRERLDNGFDFASLSTDARLFTTVLTEQLAQARAVPAKTGERGQY